MTQLRSWCSSTPIITVGQLSYNLQCSRNSKINHSIITPTLPHMWFPWSQWVDRQILRGGGCLWVVMFTLETAEAVGAASTVTSDLHLSDESLNSEDVGDDLFEFISLTSRWATYITSLFCFSFCFHSHFSICFVYPPVFFYSLPVFVSSFLSSALSVCSFLFTFCHTNHSFTLPSVSSVALSASPTVCVQLTQHQSLFQHHGDPVLDCGRLSTLEICSVCDPIITGSKAASTEFRIVNRNDIYTDGCSLTGSNKLGNYTHNCTKNVHRKRTNCDDL